MSLQFKTNWEETRERFSAWWGRKNAGRPLLNIWTGRDECLENPFVVEPYTELSERYLNTEKIMAHEFDRLCKNKPVAEAYPSVSFNLGAGSLALYLGCEASFNADTLWFLPFMNKLPDDGKIVFDENNEWYVRHLEMYRRGKEAMINTDALLEIPDLVEHMDILAAMTGPTELFEDFFEHPDLVNKAHSSLNDHYKTVFDAFNEFCMEDETGFNAFTAFAIYGSGRTSKIQCDTAAMISPGQFRDFALEPLREQCRWLNNSLFHLDGPECICHIPALMEIDELNAIQWTPGHGNPESGEECWYDMFGAVTDAGKGLWVALGGYDPQTAIEKADKLVQKFGSNHFYFLMPFMTQKEADKLLIKAEREWKC